MHFIDSLSKGGAETLLVGIINGLHEYNHVVVVLSCGNDFKDELKGVSVVCLDVRSKIDKVTSVIKLNRLIKKYQPLVIHTHLYWPTIIARCALQGKTRLVSTYHSLMYDVNNCHQYSKRNLILDKLTYRQRYFTHFVSTSVKENVSKAVGIRANNFVVYNFVADKFFDSRGEKLNKRKCGEILNVVLIGNYRPEKNYEYVIKNVAGFDDSKVRVDIYGAGDRSYYQAMIDQLGCDHVELHGATNKVSTVLMDADLFIMASSHEGFGIALAEAMVIGLPVLISNTPVFEEVTDYSALYFNVDKEFSLSHELSLLLEDQSLLYKCVENMGDVIDRYRYGRFISEIRSIYNG